MRDTDPDESLDAEGLPDLEDRPPGITVETAQEGAVAPRDHPIAAGGDPAYPVTAAEQRTPESIVERARRELPDTGAEELGVGGGVAGSGRRPSSTSVAGDADTEGGPLIDPAGDDATGLATAELAEGGEISLSPEEAAMEIVDDDRV